MVFFILIFCPMTNIFRNDFFFLTVIFFRSFWPSPNFFSFINIDFILNLFIWFFTSFLFLNFNSLFYLRIEFWVMIVWIGIIVRVWRIEILRRVWVHWILYWKIRLWQIKNKDIRKWQDLLDKYFSKLKKIINNLCNIVLNYFLYIWKIIKRIYQVEGLTLFLLSSDKISIFSFPISRFNFFFSSPFFYGGTFFKGLSYFPAFKSKTPDTLWFLLGLAA